MARCKAALMSEKSVLRIMNFPRRFSNCQEMCCELTRQYLKINPSMVRCSVYGLRPVNILHDLSPAFIASRRREARYAGKLQVKTGPTTRFLSIWIFNLLRVLMLRCQSCLIIC